MPERVTFRLELFSRGGDPRSPLGRVFELPCPGLPADARLFGLIDTDAPETTSILGSLVRNAMLSSETLAKRTLQTGIEGKFEAILLAVNRGYAELAASGTVPAEPLPTALLGMVVGNDLFVTGRGGVQALLFRPTEGTTPRNLFADGETAQDRSVLFRTIISGTLRADDILLVTSAKLFDYVALHHLARLLMSMPASAARTRILELLSDVPAETCLSGVIIGAPAAERPANRPLLKRKAAEPAKTPTADLPTGQAGLPAGQTGVPFAQPGIRRKAKPLGAALAALRSSRALPAARRSFGALGGVFRGAVRRIRTLLADRAARERLVADLRAAPDRLIATWNGQPRRSRLGIIALVLLLLLFGESLRFLSRGRAEQTRIRVYNDAVAAVQARRDAAEASLIYKDEPRAWEALAEAETAVKTLPQRTEAERRTAADLLAQIEADREKLRHVTRLDALAPLAVLPEGAGPGVSLLAGEKLLTLVTGTGGAWNWDLGKKSLAQAIAPFLAEGVALRAFPGTPSPLFFTGTSMVQRVATTTVKTAVTTPDDARVAAAALWNGRLYGLAPDANQVFRGTKGRTWPLATQALADPDVRDGRDLAIDGEIWVATQTGVKRYLKGADQRFAMKPFDPAPARLARIWTNAATDLLALYDEERKRVYVLDKDGSFKAQYVGGPADDLRDLAWDGKTRTLWLLTATALYETRLPE